MPSINRFRGEPRAAARKDGANAMPALITHDFFGRSMLRATLEDGSLAGLVGSSRDERDAFLLGNQGPDPLFYAAAVPWLAKFGSVGSRMHDEKPGELLCAMRRAADMLPTGKRSVGIAYLAGFVCHYALDSTAHPLIFAQQYAICDAGVPGLTRADGTEVHAVIESELDEMTLFTRTGLTIEAYAPQREVLRASADVLDTVSRLYCYAALVTYGVRVPQALFAACVRSFRRVQRFFHSPTGRKREIVSGIERLVRPHSFYGAMSHRPVPRAETAFENRERAPWTNPFTGEASNASFADLVERAKGKAAEGMRWACAERFEASRADEITGGLNFSGKPSGANAAKAGRG